jgi:Signal transduction histidine kinase regulating C4-dicarboxylate transport system
MKLEPAILQSVIDESITETIDRLTLQGINMQIKYPDEPVMVQVDREKLKLAFSNIIINATEAITGPGGKISIKVESNDKYHSVTISDNGCGISEETFPASSNPTSPANATAWDSASPAPSTSFKAIKPPLT